MSRVQELCELRSVSSYRNRIDLRSFFPTSFFAGRGKKRISRWDEGVASWGACLERDLYLMLALHCKSKQIANSSKDKKMLFAERVDMRTYNTL